MASESTDTRSKIIAAARSEFLSHGYEGTRLHSIADRVGVTKAMIHYYFDTKKNLFEHVYQQSAEQMFKGLSEQLDKDIPLFKKIEQVIDHCLEKAESHAKVLGFVLTESERHTDWLLPILDDSVSIDTTAFAQQIDEAASDYQIMAVHPSELLLNIFSLCYYPTLSTAVNRSLLPENATDGPASNRKGIVLDTVLNWLTA